MNILPRFKQYRGLHLAQMQPRIFKLIAENKLTELKKLLNDEVQLTVRNDEGQTAVIFASLLGNKLALELLLSANINLYSEDFNGRTAHMTASIDDHPDCLEVLLNAGADPNYTNLHGRSALMFACDGACEKSIKLLLDRGADPNLLDRQNRNAFYYLENGRDHNIVASCRRSRLKKMLLRHPKYNHRTDSKKQTLDTELYVSFPELIGRHANTSIYDIFYNLFKYYIGLVFIAFMLLGLAKALTTIDFYFAILLCLPALSFFFAYSLLQKARKLVQFRIDKTESNGLNTKFSKVDHSQMLSQTEYLQTIMDFEFKNLSNRFVEMTDQQVVKWAKQIVFLPIPLAVLAISNLIWWAVSAPPYSINNQYAYASEFAWYCFLGSLVIAWLEFTRRKASLVRIHAKLDQTAAQLLASDTDKVEKQEFILYLRAFESTGKLKVGSGDFESTISQFLANRIMLVTFGVPGEYSGAARVQSTETKWQQDVTKLMHEAKHILMLPSDRPGTVWEGQQIKELGLLHKTSFVMPPQMRVGKRPYSETWKRAYKTFRRIGLQIPKHVEKGLIFSLLPTGELGRFSLFQETSLFLRLYGANLSIGAEGYDAEDGNDGDGGGGDGG